MLKQFNQNFTQLQLQDDCGCATIQKVTYKQPATVPILDLFERGVTMGDIRYKSRGNIQFESLACCKKPMNSSTADSGCSIYSKRTLFGAAIPVCCDDTSTTIDDEKIRVLAQAKRDLAVRIMLGSGDTLGIANHPETVRSNVTTDFDAQQAVFEALFRASEIGTPTVVMSPAMMKAVLAGQPTVGNAFTANLQMLNAMLCSACDSTPKIIVSDLLQGKQAFVFPADDLVYYLSEYEGGLCKDMVSTETSTSSWMLMATIADGFNTTLHFGYAFAGVIGQMQYYTHIKYV
jgi:hypothetical protein